MVQTGALRNSEVQELVYTWFRKLTDKVALEELLVLLSADGLEMHFPEQTLRSHADFKEWYAGVAGLYFDQVHDVKLLTIEPAGAYSEVNLIVHWQARTWEPPAAYSKGQGFNVHQEWTVKRDPGSGRPVIVRYHVRTFDPVKVS